MSIKYKTETVAALGAAEVEVYTVPNNVTTTLTGLNIANITAESISISVKVAGVHLIKDVAVPTGTAISLIEKDLRIIEGETVTVQSSAAASADVLLTASEDI